jgi:hypothetical protein
MKANKMITVDVDLLKSLGELQLNVSEYCNEKLWDYVTKMENNNKSVVFNEEDIKKQLESLEEKKILFQREKEKQERMEVEGITLEKITFLKNMSTNISGAKDSKLNWLRRFGEGKDWLELLELKRVWGE